MARIFNRSALGSDSSIVAADFVPFHDLPVIRPGGVYHPVPPPPPPVYGTNGSDWLDGWTGDDRIYGLGGHDTIRGYVGNDELHGGLGNDALLGEQGAD